MRSHAARCINTQMPHAVTAPAAHFCVLAHLVDDAHVHGPPTSVDCPMALFSIEALVPLKRWHTGCPMSPSPAQSYRVRICYRTLYTSVEGAQRPALS
jgi:hypothetical protein